MTTDSETNNHVGQRLRTRRMMMGFSQEALGKKVGVAAQQVQKYEKGTNSMNAVRLLQFAQILEVPVAYFFEGLMQHGSESDAKITFAVAEEGASFQHKQSDVSDRETLELLKSFKSIPDHALRKRLADLMRTISVKIPEDD